MAHFAKIDENNIVTQVVVVDNKEKILGGTWKQTSYNGNMRKNYAGIGYTYRADIDAFVPPKPFPSWLLNADAQWEPPVAMPTDGQMYTWDEENINWILTNT
jgi:hypothetical protein